MHWGKTGTAVRRGGPPVRRRPAPRRGPASLGGDVARMGKPRRPAACRPPQPQAPPRPSPPAVTRRAPPRIRSPSPAARRRSPHWRGGGGEGGWRWGWEGGEGRRPGERSSEGETGRGARREQWGEDKVRRGRRKKNLRTGERGVGRMKKIGGEHITVGSYYNPAVMLTYHRRFVIRPGGDARASPPGRITNRR